MAVNKVIVGGEVKIDLTADTVSKDNLLAGATAHNAAGEQITGAMVTVPVDSELNETSTNAIQNKAVARAVMGGKELSGSTGYTVNDSVEYPILGLKVYGKSIQDSTPTPGKPVPIVSVVNPVFTVSNGTNSISVTLSDTLNAIPVSSGGNFTIDGQRYTSDYVDFGRGVIVTRLGVKVLDGSESWTKSNNTSLYYTALNELKKVENYIGAILCDSYVTAKNNSEQLKNENSSTISGYYDVYNSYKNANWLYIRNTNYSTVYELKKALSSSPVTVIYELALPIETRIPEAEMQAYRQLQTYNGVTNISNDKGAGIEVSYCTNKALSACVAPITTGLQKQIDDLKVAVLGLSGNV